MVRKVKLILNLRISIREDFEIQTIKFWVWFICKKR